MEASPKNRPQSYRGRANSSGTARVDRRRNQAPRGLLLTDWLTVPGAHCAAVRPPPAPVPGTPARPSNTHTLKPRHGRPGRTLQDQPPAAWPADQVKSSRLAPAAIRAADIQRPAAPPIWLLSRTTNLCPRRTHWPRIVSGSHEVRTTTGMAVGHWARRPARTPLNSCRLNSLQTIAERPLTGHPSLWTLATLKVFAAVGSALMLAREIGRAHSG